jgi:toxin-antitoxin system PIN domain toxin
MTFLLDVNVLIALIDPLNSRNADAHNWFNTIGRSAWATCPITENGTIRILGNSRYPNFLGNPAAVTEIMTILTALPGHEFWNDNISLTDVTRIDRGRLGTSSQITDTYLLALTVAHRGMFATFDTRVATSAVLNGNQSLYLIP